MKEGRRFKKPILSLILAGIVMTELANVPAYAIFSKKNNNTSTEQVKKVSISKSYKQRQQSDEFKYEHINYNWWNNFNDGILKAYIAKAIQSNYTLKNATIAVDEYYQSVKVQFANELPQAGFGFSTAYVKKPGTNDADWTYSLPGFANYELDLFLKNHDKTKASKKLYEASIQDERAGYIAVAAAVGTTYLNIVKLDKIISLQEEIVQDRKTILDLMQIRNEEGLTSTSDTVKANKSFIAGQTQLTEYKKQRDLLLNKLCVLIGENPNNSKKLQRISFDRLSYSGVIPSEISTQVITNRPDYIKAEKMVEKAGLDVKIAKKEFLPTFNITGIIAFMASDVSKLWTTKNALMALAGAANWGFFTGGRKVANLKIKKSEYERVLNDYYQTNLVAFQEINDALVIIKQDNKKYRDTLMQSQLEKKDFTLSNAKFEAGTISKFDLIQLKENVLATERMVAEQKVDCLVDYIGLYKALGSQL